MITVNFELKVLSKNVLSVFLPTFTKIVCFRPQKAQFYQNNDLLSSRPKTDPLWAKKNQISEKNFLGFRTPYISFQDKILFSSKIEDLLTWLKHIQSFTGT